MNENKKKPSRKRNRGIRIRMTDEEYKKAMQLYKKSGEPSLQAFGMDAIFKGKFISKAYTNQMKELNRNFADYIQQLRGIATNINQIAHVANGTGYADINSAKELNAEVLEELEKGGELWQSIRSLVADATPTEQ